MNTPAPRKSSRKAFTLVEMLVVVVIITILAALVTAAVHRARIAAIQAGIKTDISQLEMALDDYRIKHGEYPPDFTNPDAVTRHLLRVFPRYDYRRYTASPPYVPYDQFRADLKTNYALDPNDFDPASALAFWLGGLPERYDPKNPNLYSQKPAGFHTDPTQPFKQGGPRTKPLFNIDYKDENPQDNRFVIREDWGGGVIRYYRYYPERIREAPYVYFRARRDPSTARYEYGSYNATTSQFEAFGYDHMGAGDNVARPYLVCDPANVSSLPDASDPKTVRAWRSPEKFQIICSGLDGRFSTLVGGVSGRELPFRYTRSARYFSEGDYDNMTNFTKGATLEDEIE